MLAHAFMRHAYLAGTFVALACGLVGWFVVLRGQVFAGDALSHVAFVGSIAAATVGLDNRIGLFLATLLAGGVMARLGRRARADDAAIGTIFAWILGLGLLFLALLATSAPGGGGLAAANTLFGSIFGLSRDEALLAAAIALALTLALLAIARPLLFASVDPEVAAVQGVPVGLLGLVFLMLLGATAAESAQAVGALLLLGLIAAPAGAAHRLTARPWAGLAIAAGLAVGATWGGLALSYTVPSLPPSTAIIALATLAFGLTAVKRRSGERAAAPGARRARAAARQAS